MANKEDLTVQEALSLILQGVTCLPAETIPFHAALDRVLADPVTAQHDMPPFANSAMDGYALRAVDIQTAAESPVTLAVRGDIAAGSVPAFNLKPGEAARIMTGAPLPAGADAVIPVEETNELWRSPERPLPDEIQINRPVQPGDYLRHPGEDVRCGEVVIARGHRLRPQEIGVLASLGATTISVIRRPRVGILATGDELIPVDQVLSPGKIRNSNSYTQAAQVTAIGGIPVPLGIARDTEEDVRSKLEQGLNTGVDLFISSAGVSVGAYDVVKAVLEAEGNVGFWRVRMRPGKPLAFGTYHGVPYLGLPGNPVSAMVSFERFARAAIRKMAGFTTLERPQRRVIVRESLESDGRESYIRAIVTEKDGQLVAVTTGGQGSHMMTSLVKANALLIIPEGVTHVPSGGELNAWMMDWPEWVH